MHAALMPDNECGMSAKPCYCEMIGIGRKNFSLSLFNMKYNVRQETSVTRRGKPHPISQPKVNRGK